MPHAALDPTHDILARHEQFLSPNYGRYPIAMVRGRGSRLWDARGNEYLDLFAGFGGSLLGHCHPDLIEAVTEQAGRLWFAGNLFHTEPQTHLARHIADQGFGGRSFFCHSGADANEAAIKLARLHGRAKPGPGGPRHKIITAAGGFHGRTFATMAATGQERVSEGFAPLTPGFVHVAYDDLSAIEQAVDDQTAAIMIEPIQGEGGVCVPDDDYLPGLRRLCDEHDLVLMLDEVWTGGGRTGRPFAHQHWNITPDVMTLAKGVGGGLPVGVCCIRPEHACHFDPQTHGGVAHASTLGGNCLSMAAAARVFEVIQRDRLTEHATDLGEHARRRIQSWAEHLPAVREARGKGLFLGIELDPDADGAWFSTGREVVDRCLERGVYLNAAQSTVLRLAPPLVIERDDLDRGLDIIESVIRG